MKDKVREKLGILPHSRPTVGGSEARAAERVVRTGFISQGPRVREFEKALAAYIGVKDVVVTNSGTAAIHLCLLSMGIGRGHEVLMPSYVCTAPLNAVYQAGASPVLCDIDTDSFNISIENLENKKTAKSRAMIVPHMFGAPADMEKIEELNVPVIEDCAHSIGAVYGKMKTGSMGRAGIFSFYANKMMACGEGGAIASNDKKLIDAARELREYDNKDDYKVRFNYKMSDVLAAIGLVQLKKLPAMIRARKRIAAAYSKAFRGTDLTLPKAEFDHIYYRYIIRSKKDSKRVIASMADSGITAAMPVYNPLHRYLGLSAGFRNTDEIHNSAVSIPIYPSMSPSEQKKVIKAVLSAY